MNGPRTAACGNPKPSPTRAGGDGHLALKQRGSAPGHAAPVATHRLHGALRRAQVGKRGVIAPLVAVATPVLIGFAGLAIDVAQWEVTKSAMQGAADRAVLAAGTATARVAGDQIAEARAIAASHGFKHGTDAVAVDIGIPQSGTYAGNANALEVTISQKARMNFTGLFLQTAPTVTGRAVALSDARTCVVALGESGATITLTSSARIALPNCDLYNNSATNPGTTLTSSANITAKNLSLVTNYSTSSSASVTVTGALKRGVGAAKDPYAGRTLPAYHSGCDRSNYSIDGSASNTFTAGSNPFVFCGTTTANSSTRLTFNPGIYVFKGPLNLNSSSTVTANGATFIFTGTGGVNASSSSVLTMTAPSTGPTAGIAVWNTTSGVNISSSGEWQVVGALYAPNGAVNISSSGRISRCMQVIARSFDFSSSSLLTLNHNCDGVGVENVRVFRLVE